MLSFKCLDLNHADPLKNLAIIPHGIFKSRQGPIYKLQWEVGFGEGVWLLNI